MNKYMDALWDLKLRVDAYNERDEKANRAFDILKELIKRVEAAENAQVTTDDAAAAIEFMKKHVEVQDHPDMFFHREQPERVLIDLRYLIDTGDWAKTPDNIEANNEGYNLVKRVLGLPEYKGE
jgi:hypothetical protein